LRSEISHESTIIGIIVVSARILNKEKPIAGAKWIETCRLKPKAVLEINGAFELKTGETSEYIK